MKSLLSFFASLLGKSLFKNSLRILFLFGFLVSFGQNQISFRQLSVKDGLSQNSAISIAQDSTGYLWIATQDGLNKYEGRNFQQFPYSFEDVTRPKYSNLGKVYVNREGEIWILPIDRIPYKLNTTSQEFEPLQGITEVSAIFQSTDKSMWFGTYDKGLYQLAKNSDSLISIRAKSDLGAIYMIAEKPNGLLTIASNKNLFQLNHKNNSLEPVNPTTANGIQVLQNFSALVCDNNKRQWAGTFGDGLYFKEANESVFKRISALSFNDPLPLDLNILDLHIDQKDRLWIATYGDGLYMVNFLEEKVNHFDIDQYNPRALHYNDVLCIYEDYTGTLWFGTDGGGISYYDEYLEKFNSMTNYQTPENISTDVVRSIAIDAQDGVWIGTSGKGLTYYDPNSNSWQSYKTNSGNENTVPSNRIMSLMLDSAANLWIGTQGAGLSIRDKKGNFTNYNAKTTVPLSANTIWNIFMDENETTWLATRNQGLIKFSPKQGELQKFKHETTNALSIPSNNVRIIEQGTKGNLWLGTEENGIALFDTTKGTFTSYKHHLDTNSLSNNNIKSLYLDANEVLWIGTNGSGLDAFDTKNNIFYNYDTKDGLANDVIYAILPDDAGNLWLSSNKGITKFKSNENLEKSPEIVNYTNYDGLATEFNTGAYQIDQYGNLYFGGLDGFYWFKPEDIEDHQILPKTTITGFDVGNEAYPMVEHLELTHEQNTLTFTFSSLQYSLPEKNQYQYKLVNYDSEWVHAGNTNFARYSYLKPGSYEFEVKSSNYDGVWNERPAVLPFSIAPPWYLTSWAKLLYFLLFLTVLFAIYRYFKWKWRMELNFRRKEDEALKLQELNQLKSKLYTDISHEFRTPLTLISGPIDAKLGESGLTNADINNFSMIRRNTNRMLGLVDQLLDLAKVDDGKLKLKMVKGDLTLFLKTIAASFEYAAESANITYTAAIEPMGNVYYDEDALEKITTNLLSNAMKYSPEGGKCNISAHLNNNKAYIAVKNTTTDLSKIEFDKIFTRFYQKDEFAAGAGVGLSLVHELVKLYGGSITAKPHENKNILFEIQLPITVKSDLIADGLSPNTAAVPNNDLSLDQINTHSTRNADEEKEGLPIVLVVEDNTDVRSFITRELAKEYKVLEAVNGKEGVDLALETIPNVILSDVRMPTMDGIELCNTLKNDERTSHIPIILLTAHIGEENELEGLSSGADDFITKPFKLRVLKSRVHNVISTRKALRIRYSQELVLKPKDIAITPTDVIFLNRLQEVLDKHLSNPEFDTKAFCAAIGMSRMQLHRKLLAFTGLSTTAFIRSQRLRQAIHILKTSDASINEVAYSVGFNTPSYFIKCFKETYKKTPSEYIQSSE